MGREAGFSTAGREENKQQQNAGIRRYAQNDERVGVVRES